MPKFLFRSLQKSHGIALISAVMIPEESGIAAIPVQMIMEELGLALIHDNVGIKPCHRRLSRFTRHQASEHCPNSYAVI